MQQKSFIEGTIRDWSEYFDIPYESLRLLIKQLNLEPTGKRGKQKLYSILDWNDKVVKEVEKYKIRRTKRTTISDVLLRVEQLESQIVKLGKAVKLLSQERNS